VANDSKLDDEGMSNHQSDDNVENATVVMSPDANAEVKFVPDGHAGTMDVTTNQNGPTGGIPSTSADGVIKTDNGDKGKKAKKEKPEVVGLFDLVGKKFFRVIFFYKKHVHTHTTILQPSWILSDTTEMSWHQKGKTRKVKPVWIFWSKR